LFNISFIYKFILSYRQNLMKLKNLLYGLFILLFIGCNKKNEQIKQNSYAPKVIDAKGYTVPADSIKQPVIIELDESKLPKIPLGRPKVFPTNTNIQLVGKPEIVIAGVPKVCTPGQDTFLMPKIIPAIDSPFAAGISEVTPAKDAYIKEENSQNFSCFGKLQGLKHNDISCISQDHNGNLWFCTSGGGVTKYDGKFFTHFTVNEGLNNNNVYSICQDRNNNIWYGTSTGVTKYDGKSFTHYTEKEGLSNNRVYSIIQDRTGNLWFATYLDGVIKYDGKNFTHFTKKQGLNNQYINCIFQDIENNLWFGTDGGGLSKYDGRSFTNYTTEQGLSSNNVNCILGDTNGNLWLGTNAGVCIFNIMNKQKDIASFTTYAEKQGLSNNTVYSIIRDNSGNFWFGTFGGGVTKFDSKYFYHYTEKEGLSDNKVNNIFQDKSGNIWVSTTRGVNKYDGKTFTNFSEKEGLNNNYIMCLFQDNTGSLWIGTDDNGITKYDGKSFNYYNETEILSKTQVLSIFQDKSSNLWFGTYEGVFKFNGKYLTYFSKKDGLVSSAVIYIFQDNSGDLWFCTLGGVSKYHEKSPANGQLSFTNYTEKEGLSNKVVYGMLQDTSGSLWFGTYGGGVTKFDGQCFTHYSKKEGLCSNSIISMMQDRSGNLWFGSYGGGITRYDGHYFTNYTEKEGLSNNVIYTIIQDKQGNLWFGSRFGLNKIAYNDPCLKQKKEFDKSISASEISDDIFFRSYTFEDGFLGIGCNRSAMVEDKKTGLIWIGANDRLTAYHPDGDQPDTIPPNIQITGISLFNENINWVSLETNKDTSFVLGNGVRVGNFDFESTSMWYGLPENLSLAHNNNYLTFNFIGITSKSPKKVKYKYKLEGLDENWSALTSRTEAPYGNLPHGTYTFKVKAMNSEGYWSEEYQYNFTIRPPWWKTWWFRTVEFITILLLIFGYIKWRERKLKKDKELLQRKVKEQTIELHEKNEELKSQNEEITTQRDEINVQKNIIEHKNKNITDSIRYAQRIQHAILPRKEKMDALLNEHFVLYHPKDIVSGDFYWVEQGQDSNAKNNVLFAAVDCTGHGVPGAFMSLLGYNGLQQAVKENGVSKPGDILNFLNNYIRSILREQKEDFNVKDGMDIFLCSFNSDKMLLEYAGVHNTAFLVRNGEVITLKPDQQAIGEAFTDKFTGYTNNQLKLEKEDCIYLFTDGYIDQFGGTERKKFMKPRFKELLLEIHSLNTEEQKKKLEENYEKWRGDELQIDDILILGVKV
jgi:ligand-binding sensor domain-containing protein/serine phosphatase RsbU (regulator of sigma subunit)